MKTILYVRVSSDEQAEYGHSIRNQEVVLKAYCKKMNIKRYQIYNDEGYTAFSEKRPMYQKLKKEIKQGNVERIIVLKMDRFSRKTKDFNKFEELMKEFDVEFISLSEKFDDNAMGNFSKNITMLVGELEIGQISERTHGGLNGSYEKGFYPVGGILPLGISRNRENSGIHYNEQSKIVKEIFKLNKLGYSFVSISKIIDEKYEEELKERYKNGIGSDAVERIVKNTVYQGYKIRNGKKYEVIEPLFDASEMFEIKKTKTGLTVKVKNKRIKYKHNYKFNGKIIYKELNNILFAQTTRKKVKTTGVIREYKYYVSSDRVVKINQDYFEKMLKKHIKLDERHIENKIKKQMSNLKDLYVMGDIDKEEYKNLKRKITVQKQDLSQYRFEDDNIVIDSNYNIVVSIKDKHFNFNYKDEIKSMQHSIGYR